ncbi:hypothetical protein [Geobacillus subterraneus]|uniref:hypothetical protein n=1 Tax=Geobacillus subterraneus TaxID=129338 RepID=UPI0015527D3A|nr:hypothetical protein [Geobacillus subterraneus]
MAELSVFDFLFLLAEFPGRSSVMVGDFETFHAEFRSFPMLFRENAALARDFHPRVEGRSHCPWNFSVKMPN